MPDGYFTITSINVGKKAGGVHPYLSEQQAALEMKRPERKPLAEYAYHNRFQAAA
jgi:hypothetical protein